MPRFGKDRDQNARKEELDRQAAEEVERLTRRAGPPGMGGGMGGGPGGPPIGIPTPLERMAAEMQDAPRGGMRRLEGRKRTAPPQQQAFTPMPTGGVGSSFGPGGLNPGPRMGGMAPPPPAFAGGDYDDDFAGSVTGPPVYNAEPDEDEEMSITEMALMDHAARTGHNPEDLVMRYDASGAEEMRDRAMRDFYERQQSRRPGAGTNNPFAPAGMRGGGGAGPGQLRRPDDPRAAGGALAQRLARRRQEEEAARRASEPEPEPAPTQGARLASRASRVQPAQADEGDGALANLLARRRRALGMDASAPAVEAEPEAEEPLEEEADGEHVPTGSRHAQARAEASPELRVVPVGPVAEDDDERPAPVRRTRKAPAKAATKKAAKAAPAAKTAKAPAAKAAAKKAAKAAPAAKSTKTATKAKRTGATLAGASAKAPAKKATKPRTVFCIECGEKNPAIAKFCFNCGTRLAAPEQ